MSERGKWQSSTYICQRLSSRLDFCFVTHYHRTELLVRLSWALMTPNGQRYVIKNAALFTFRSHDKRNTVDLRKRESPMVA